MPTFTPAQAVQMFITEKMNKVTIPLEKPLRYDPEAIASHIQQYGSVKDFWY